MQVGDPFKEKLLLEACLELLATDAVAGIQDMGAAGLTCSTCETASRGGTGIEIDLAKVPKREPGMTPYEMLLSESQERMLIIAKRGQGKCGPRNFREMGCALRGNRPRDGRRHDARAQQRRDRRGNPRQTAGRRSAALFARSKKPPREPQTDAELIWRKSLRSQHPRDRISSSTAARSDDRVQELGLSPIRSHGAHRHASSSRARTPPFSSFARRTKFWPPPPIAIRSIARSIRARAAKHRRRGSGAQSHLLRRNAAGRDR